MRRLHVVGVSDDGTSLLLAASQDAVKPSHALPLDDRLRAATRGDLLGDNRAESALTPKEIQARLRSGETVEDVAKAAGVPATRVRFYASPVLSERERVIEDAQRIAPRRDRGPAGRPLGEAVEAKLAATVGLKPESVRWSARRRDDGAWVVSLSYSARGGARTLEWLWVQSTHELRSLSAAASRMTAPDPHAKPGPGHRATARTGGAAAARKPRAAASGGRSGARAAVANSKRGTTRAATPAPRSVPVRRKPRKPAAEVPQAPRLSERPTVSTWTDVLFGAADGPGVEPPAEGPAAANGRTPGSKSASARKGASARRSAPKAGSTRRRRG